MRLACVTNLPSETKGQAQDALAASLRREFLLAACVSGLGYVVHLAVRSIDSCHFVNDKYLF